MQAVILAAGQGTRLRPLTNNIPKTMVDLNGQPILWWVLSALPKIITDIVIVTGYRGEAIERALGNTFKGRNLTYIHQTTLNGTLGALVDAKPALDQAVFLVLHGDNIYDNADLERLAGFSLALGVHNELRPTVKLLVDVDDTQTITGWHTPNPDELTSPVNVCAGSYMLDQRIFSTEPVRLSSGEIGLPQTLLELAKTAPVRLVEHQIWHEINTLEDLDRAKQLVKY